MASKTRAPAAPAWHRLALGGAVTVPRPAKSRGLTAGGGGNRRPRPVAHLIGAAIAAAILAVFA
ncbi:hypothetical protein J4558_00140 [Leptolyngbya sp. 15MV]|nr:hypothetical protein J4558_00140 [Leptolyngbya sp. 15MV]